MVLIHFYSSSSKPRQQQRQ
uniref:Uncharacterized protein n=1 Tax=Rhizophora mucronata TaxID=61149 RepID=A0A2P2M0E9_RHIMU